MFYLRVTRNRNYFLGGTFDQSKVIEAMSSRDGTPPSVYLVSDMATADRIAVIYSMYFKAQPESLDYVLLPEELIRKVGVTARKDPGDINHPLLLESHHELLGFEQPGVLESFCQEAANADLQTKRLAKSDVRRIALLEIQEASTGADLLKTVEARPGWAFLQAPGSS